MTETGKEADLRTGDPAPGAVSDLDPEASRATAPAVDPTEGGPAAKRRDALSVHTRNRIAAQLRAMYDTVAQQPVPDRFAELIAKLDANDGRTRG